MVIETLILGINQGIPEFRSDIIKLYGSSVLVEILTQKDLLTGLFVNVGSIQL